MRVYFLQLLFCTRLSLICQVCHMVAVIPSFQYLNTLVPFIPQVYTVTRHHSDNMRVWGCTEEKQKKQGVVGRLICKVRNSARHSLVLRDTFDTS